MAGRSFRPPNDHALHQGPLRCHRAGHRTDEVQIVSRGQGLVPIIEIGWDHRAGHRTDEVQIASRGPRTGTDRAERQIDHPLHDGRSKLPPASAIGGHRAREASGSGMSPRPFRMPAPSRLWPGPLDPHQCPDKLSRPALIRPDLALGIGRVTLTWPRPRGRSVSTTIRSALSTAACESGQRVCHRVGGGQHEIADGNQAHNLLSRRSQEERGSRGRLLGGPERDRSTSRDDGVGFDWRDQRTAPTRQPLIGTSALRAGILPEPNSGPSALNACAARQRGAPVRSGCCPGCAWIRSSVAADHDAGPARLCSARARVRACASLESRGLNISPARCAGVPKPPDEKFGLSGLGCADQDAPATPPHPNRRTRRTTQPTRAAPLPPAAPAPAAHAGQACRWASAEEPRAFRRVVRKSVRY